MKRIILGLLLLIPLPLMAQTGTPSTSLRYGDLFPKSGDNYDIGHPLLYWDNIYVNDIIGNPRNIEATIPAVGFISGTADYNGEYWQFSDISSVYARTFYFQFPENYDMSKKTIDVCIGWNSVCSPFPQKKIKWVVKVYMLGNSGNFTVIGNYTIEDLSWYDHVNITSWTTIPINNIQDRRCFFIGVTRDISDSLTCDANFHYIQIKVPVRD